jgi:hypothetical protein
MQEEPDKSYLLIGVWKLINITNRDAQGNILRSSYGPRKMGLITFNDDHRMMVVISDGREHLPSARPREYSSYAGTYRFDGTTLVTRVDCSTVPDRMHTDQVRPAVLAGNRVTLSAPPADIEGVVHYRQLTWEKIH